MIYIKVRVIAGSKKEEINKIDDFLYHVSVKEEKERGLANARVRSLLEKDLARDGKSLSLKMIKGGRSSSKVFSCEYYDSIIKVK